MKMSKKSDVSPFVFINNINKGIKSIDDVTGYNKYLVNMNYSFHYDTILYSNRMNMWDHYVNDKMNYDFFKASVRPKFRKHVWYKKKDKEKHIEYIKERLNVNQYTASKYYNLLSDKQKKAIDSILEEKND